MESDGDPRGRVEIYIDPDPAKTKVLMDGKMIPDIQRVSISQAVGQLPVLEFSVLSVSDSLYRVKGILYGADELYTAGLLGEERFRRPDVLDSDSAGEEEQPSESASAE